MLLVVTVFDVEIIACLFFHRTLCVLPLVSPSQVGSRVPGRQHREDPAVPTNPEQRCTAQEGCALLTPVPPPPARKAPVLVSTGLWPVISAGLQCMVSAGDWWSMLDTGS